MRKRSPIWQLLLSVLLATSLSCSSKDKADEEAPADVQADQAAADQAAADQAAVDPAVTDSSMAPPPDPNAVPETKEGDLAANSPADPNAAPVDPLALPPDAGMAAPPVDPNAAAVMEPPPATDAPAPPADTAAPTDTAQSDSGTGDLFGASAETEAPKPKKASLPRVKDAPFERGGQLLNTVYIAREGDTLEGISQKLFGEDRTKDLKKANPPLKRREARTGDLVYFNSPNRPDDREKLLTVYEDQGIPPTIYTTKEGDTLRSLATDWYGSENSYKELYALNKQLSSSRDLPPGTELTGWPPTAVVAVYGVKAEPEVAQAPPPPPPPPAIPPTDPMAQASPPSAAGAVGEMPLPPPPPTDMAAAPPPPPPMASKRKTKESAMDKDTVMYAAAGGVLLIGGAALVAIRRRNSRKGQGLTQV